MVADSSMVEFHEESDHVEMYLLTMMNMVSSLYKDPTIGNSIQVVVVRMIVLEDEEAYEDLNVTHIAGSTLDSFCRFVVCSSLLYVMSLAVSLLPGGNEQSIQKTKAIRIIMMSPFW